jgi:hypothetical protein
MTDPAMPGTSIPLPVPPDLGPTLGYPGDARYVVFYIDADLDDVIYNDGARTGNGATWVFQAYRRHPAIQPLLQPFDLNHEHCLVFDLTGTRASVCTGSDAAEFLRQHRPPLPPSPPVTEEPGSLVEQITTGWRGEQVDQEAVRRSMEEQRGRVGRMLSWLEQCPTPGPQEGRGA